MKSDNVSVTVANRPDLSHDYSSLRFFNFGINLFRLTPETGSVSQTGPHIFLHIPSGVVVDCFEREMSVIKFEGPCIGTLRERNGLSAYEYGGFLEHAVSELLLTFNVDLQAREFRLHASGKLSPKRQTKDEWEKPKNLSDFQIDARFTIEEVGSLFEGKSDEMQAAFDRALVRLAKSKA